MGMGILILSSVSRQFKRLQNENRKFDALALVTYYLVSSLTAHE